MRLTLTSEDLENQIREALLARAQAMTRQSLFRATRADNYGNGTFGDAIESLVMKGYLREVKTFRNGPGRPTTTIEWIGSTEKIASQAGQTATLPKQGHKWGPKDRSLVDRLKALYSGAAYDRNNQRGISILQLRSIMHPVPEQTFYRVLTKLLSEGFLNEYKDTTTGDSMIRAK